MCVMNDDDGIKQKWDSFIISMAYYFFFSTRLFTYLFIMNARLHHLVFIVFYFTSSQWVMNCVLKQGK